MKRKWSIFVFRALLVLALIAGAFVRPATHPALADQFNGIIQARLKYGWLEARNYSPNSTILLSIYDQPGGSLLYGPTPFPTDANGRAWIEGNNHMVDLFPEMYITMEDTASGMSKSLVVANLTIHPVDYTGSQVSGSAPSDTLVNVTLHPDGGNRQTTSNPTGEWQVDFGTPLDYRTPSAEVYDEDGDITYADPQNTTITANLKYNYIGFQQFSPNSRIVVSIYDAPGGTLIFGPKDWYTDGRGDLKLEKWDHGVDIQTGQLISVHDESTGLDDSLVIAHLEITDVDFAAGRVYGVTNPDTFVRVNMPWGPGLGTKSNPDDGQWMVDFGTPLDPDLSPNATVYDIDHDETSAGWPSYSPSIWASQADGIIFTFGWPSDATLHMCIDDDSKPSDDGCIMEQTWGGAEFDMSFWDWYFDGLQPDWYVNVSGGGYYRQMQLTDLRVIEVDAENDKVIGHASNLDRPIWIEIGENNGRLINPNENGTWSADFYEPGPLPEEKYTVNLEPGAHGQAQQPEGDGDWNFDSWQIDGPVDWEVLVAEQAGPFNMAFDNFGNLYVANEDGGSGTQIMQIRPDNDVRPFAGGFLGVSGLAMRNDGVLLASDDTNRVFEIAPDGVVTVLIDGSAGLDNPNALAVDSLGYVYVVSAGGFVSKFDQDGNLLVGQLLDGLDTPQGIVIDETTRKIYVSDAVGHIYEVNMDTGQSQLLTYVETFMTSNGGLALDGAGYLYLPNNSGDIIKINTAGGGYSYCLGGLNSPRGLAIDAEGRILVTSYDLGLILRASGCGTTKPSDRFGSISGTITDYNGQRVDKGEICADLEGVGGARLFCDNPNSNGFYLIENIPPGDYGVWWRGHPDYATMSYPDHLNWRDVQLVPVTAGQPTTGIDMVLKKGGSISGKITDSQTEEPIVYFGVAVSVKGPDDASPRIYEEYCSDEEDGGTYELESLPIDDWEIFLYASGRELDQCAGSPYGGESWEEKPDFAPADPIILTTDNPDRTNINFTLDRIPDPNFVFWVSRYGDSIEAWNWPVGSTMTIEIDDPESQVVPDYSHSMLIEDPNFGFSLDGIFDVKGGFNVTLSDRTTTKSLIVTSPEAVTVDPPYKLSGVVDESVVRIHVPALPPGGSWGIYNRIAEPDEDGLWSVDFSQPGPLEGEEGVFEIEHNTSFEVHFQDDDGDATAVPISYQLPYIEVNPGSHWVHARGGWVDGSDITMTIDDPNTPEPVDYTAIATFGPNPDNPYAAFDLLAGFDLNGFVLEAGQTITMDGGGKHKDYVIQPMPEMSFDLGADTLSGTSVENVTIQVCVNVQDHCAMRFVTADGIGHWTADYKNPGTRPYFEEEIVDLQPGMTGWSAEYEEDGDQTWTDWQVIIDTDNDGIDDSTDNAPNDFNPDQRDCDGDTIADVIDSCPGDATNTCNTSGSTAGVIGGAGGNLTTPNSGAGLNIPAGSVNEDLSFSITDTGGGYQVAVFEGVMAVLQSYSIQPHGTQFESPAILTFRWADIDNDGIVDGTGFHETHLLLIKDGLIITPSCAVNPHCDMVANELTVEVSTLSLFELSVPANQSPVADAGQDQTVNEGDVVTLDASGSSDPDDNITTYEWNLDNDGQYDDATGVTTQHTFTDNGVFIVGLRVTDDYGANATDIVQVTVANVSPTITNITAPVSPVQLGTTINVSAAFTDPGAADTFSAVWTWDDGTTSGGTVSDHIVSGTHLYAVPGVYTVRLTVTDDDGGAGILTYQYVVVYDPTGGFVTGGGWFTDSASGSKIHFGFNPKYQPNSTLLKGETEFKLSGITFKSTSHEWLVINGAKAQFKGSGTINGAGDYGFLVTVIDGTPDKIRIKIWDKESGEEFYDNQPGAPDYADPVIEIGGGSIQIHAK
jgi:PKD repeat protein